MSLYINNIKIEKAELSEWEKGNVDLGVGSALGEYNPKTLIIKGTISTEDLEKTMQEIENNLRTIRGFVGAEIILKE